MSSPPFKRLEAESVHTRWQCRLESSGQGMHLDFSLQKVGDHSTTGESNGVIQSGKVEGREKRVGKAERQHQRDPTFQVSFEVRRERKE